MGRGEDRRSSDPVVFDRMELSWQPGLSKVAHGFISPVNPPNNHPAKCPNQNCTVKPVH